MVDKCKDCGAIMPKTIKVCRFCEGKKFTNAAKSLFNTVIKDVKKVADKANQVANKAKKIRIKVDD